MNIDELNELLIILYKAEREVFGNETHTMARKKKNKLRLMDTVRTIPSLSNRVSFISKEYQKERHSNSPGFILECLKNGDFLVQHEKSILAVYKKDELILEPNAYWLAMFPACWLKEKYKDIVGESLYYKEFRMFNDIVPYFLILPNLPTRNIPLVISDNDFFNALTTSGVTIEGPFYFGKELSEGFVKPRTIFDHLTEDDII